MCLSGQREAIGETRQLQSSVAQWPYRTKAHLCWFKFRTPPTHKHKHQLPGWYLQNRIALPPNLTLGARASMAGHCCMYCLIRRLLISWGLWPEDGVELPKQQKTRIMQDLPGSRRFSNWFGEWPSLVTFIFRELSFLYYFFWGEGAE